MSDQRDKRIELILQQLEELPTLPPVALRLLEVTSDDTSSVADIVEVIGSDPSLTARILQMTSRADLGVRGEITSIDRAVVMLGFSAVRNAVLAVSVVQMFTHARERHDGKSRFDREGFWTHSVAVACCAELLAEAANQRDLNPSDAFICGLLHDLGKVALDAVLPKSFSRVVEAADLLRGNIADLERTVIGLDHMVVGKRLAERWHLPHVIRECAWLHGQPPEALPANLKGPRLVNLITLSDALVRRQHLGYSGNYAFPVAVENLCAAVGVTAPQTEAVLARLVERIEPRAKALGLGQASSDELYQHALAQANRELGQVSGQLAAKTRRLTARSRFFDALSHFQGQLRPDAAPQAVLQAVARTAVGVLGVPRVAVFSLPPGQDFAEALLCNDAGEVFDTTLIDLPGMSMVTEPVSLVLSPLSLVPDAHPVPTVDAAAKDEVSLVLSPLSFVPDAHAVPTDDAAAKDKGQVTKDKGQMTNDAPRPGDGPVLPAGEGLEWLVSAISPKLAEERRFWICLEADGACIGGVLWGGRDGEGQRLGPQAQELTALAGAWGLALRAAQVREEARTLAEQLADANRRLHDAQNELLRSRALLTVGEMAAGAAHEMNNPLAVISGRSQLLSQQLSDPRHQAAARLIHEQSHRLSAIITELMAFARPEPAVLRDADLDGLIDRAVRVAKLHNDPADRAIVLTVGDVPRVSVDEGQVSAALAEVLANAIHATDRSKGRIEVHAAFDPYSNRVVVTVSDNGHGMDEKTARRAFDPFFSNKPAGRRRGLGLAKALRWVEASGGSMRLESRVGKGTRAIVLLPAANASAGNAGAAERRAAQ